MTPTRTWPPSVGLLDMPASDDFVSLLTGSQRKLNASVFCLVWNPADADDILQETNLVFLKKAAKYDSNGEFLPWALTIARFQSLAGLERRHQPKAVVDEMAAALGLNLRTLSDRLRRIREGLLECITRTLAEGALV